MRRLPVVAWWASVLALAACATVAPPPAPPEARSPAAWPPGVQDAYAAIARTGRPVLAVDPARSLLTIEVRRAGRLKDLGHDHVVGSRALEGWVAPEDGRADVLVPLRSLTVDEPELRRAAGLSTTPSAADVEGTRANMFAHVLQVDRHPAAHVAIAGVAPAATTAFAKVTLNGVARTVPVDLAIEATRDGVRVRGQAALRQSDFGIEPFSILGGAIAVDDTLTVRFDVVARAAPS